MSRTPAPANLDNEAGGELNSALTTLNAAGAITNEGRIEGDVVTTSSATLTNAATIIGGTVTLNGSQSIVNAGAAAIVAGASGVNLYSPGAISNTGGAQVFSLGDVAIAADAARGTNGRLANRANSVTNDRSTVEAQGSIEVAAQTLTNTRPAPDIETVTTDVETIHQTKRAKYMACATKNSVDSACPDALWNHGYKSPLDSTFSTAQVVSQSSGPNATDNVLVVDVDGAAQTIYYNTLTDNGDGTITVNYWDAYDPNINYLPSTEYPTTSDGHKGYQRVEIARDTTTTTRQDQVTGAQAQQGQLLAGGDLTLANVGTMTNMGTIEGGTHTVVTATDVVNRAGTIASAGTDGTTVITATHDVLNASGVIAGNRVAVLAGNDITNTTLVDAVGLGSAAGNSKVAQTLLGAQGTIAATGDLLVGASNDLTVRGANLTAGGAASISAGHDLAVGTVQSVTSQSLMNNADHHWERTTVVNEIWRRTCWHPLAVRLWVVQQGRRRQPMLIFTTGNFTLTKSRRLKTRRTGIRPKRAN